MACRPGHDGHRPGAALRLAVGRVHGLQARPPNQGHLRALVSRSGSSMRKSFALCEAFGLTPFPSPWIPSAREGLSAGTGRPGRRHSRPWRRGPPLPALRCAQRGASVATGCCARVRGGGGGRPRPFGMLTGRGREAARRDHQSRLVRELMTRNTGGVAEKLERPGNVGRSDPMEAGFTGGLPRICRGPRNLGHAIPMHVPERHFSAGLLALLC